MTDVAIPEGHKGLHQALYGEGSEEAHSAAQYALRQVCYCICALTSATECQPVKRCSFLCKDDHACLMESVLLLAPAVPCCNGPKHVHE